MPFPEIPHCGFFLQALHNFRTKLGNIVRSQQAVVGFVYNIGNVVVKQCIHNLGNRAVSGKVINVVFDVGIEVFQTSDRSQCFPRSA